MISEDTTATRAKRPGDQPEFKKQWWRTMPDKKRYLRLQLNTPSDIREYARRLLRILKAQGEEAEISNLGKISQILSIWLKAWELDKISDIEKRLTALEAAKAQEKG